MLMFDSPSPIVLSHIFNLNIIVCVLVQIPGCVTQPTMNFAKHQFIDDCLSVGEGLPITGLYVRLEIRLSESDPIEKNKLDVIQKHLGSLDSFRRRIPDSEPTVPFILSTLLPFERKTTVSHVRLTRYDRFHDALASKSNVELQCGFRR